MQTERHEGGVTAHGVGDVAGVATLVIVFQLSYLQDTGGGTGRDLAPLVRCQDLVVTPPDHRGGGVAIERTADGGRGVDGEVQVSRVHGEFRGAWREREQKDVTKVCSRSLCIRENCSNA